MIVFTGTGFSGTGHLAALMNANGIYCGHESVFRIEGSVYEAYPDGTCPYQADSSWMAAGMTKELHHLTASKAHPTETLWNHLIGVANWMLFLLRTRPSPLLRQRSQDSQVQLLALSRWKIPRSIMNCSICSEIGVT